MYPLHEKILDLVKEERALTSRIIEALQKVADEKLYLKMGYPTLFSYCNQALGYSEACAYRRIATVRVSRELPEIKEKLDDGSLSLTTITLAQTLFKKEKFTTDEKRKVLGKIENKSKYETERILLKYTDTKDLFAPKAKFRMLTATTTQMQLTVNNEVIRKLNKIKALRSHKNPNLSYESLINDMCDFVLKKIDPSLKKQVSDSKKGNALLEAKTLKNMKNTNPTDKTSKTDASKKHFKTPTQSKYLRYIPAPMRTEVWMRDGGQCTYKDKETGQRCEANHFLEIDHIQPIYAGGTASLGNLRLLCRGHNQIRNLDYSGLDH